MIAHMVFFSLNDKSPEAQDKLVAACRTYLTDHPGLTYFSAGKLAEGLDRPVNDRGFEVALHMVFATMSDHDAYQVAPRHQTFIEENKANWSVVRVFDSIVES